ELKRSNFLNHAAVVCALFILWRTPHTTVHSHRSESLAAPCRVAAAPAVPNHSVRPARSPFLQRQWRDLSLRQTSSTVLLTYKSRSAQTSDTRRGTLPRPRQETADTPLHTSHKFPPLFPDTLIAPASPRTICYRSNET